MQIDPALARIAASAHNAPPARLGQRYNAQGFLPEAGNTVVCHLDRSDPQSAPVLAARKAMQSLPEAERLLFTPASSLHMTVFEGVIETRRTADAWPADLDRTLSVDAVTETMIPRLQGFKAPGQFRVRVAGLYPGGLYLEGAEAEDREIMQAWRRALTEPFGFRHKEHDSYRFHMTFAYILDWLPDGLLPKWQSGLNAILQDLQEAVAVLPLNPPALCQFADMTHFEEKLVLGH